MERANWIALAVTLGSLGVLIALFARPGLSFAVTFNDANGIAAGHSVYYRGDRIGEVKRVSPARPTAVDVRVSHDHRRRMHRHLSFFVERGNVLGSERRLVTYDCVATAGDPIVEDDVVAGRESTIEWATCKAAERAGPILSAAAALINSLTGTDAARSIAQSIDQYSESARKMGAEQWEAFRRERLPALEREARAYKERLEKEGKLEDARHFWQQFTAWLEQMTAR